MRVAVMEYPILERFSGDARISRTTKGMADVAKQKQAEVQRDGVEFQGKVRLLTEDQVSQWTGVPVATLKSMRTRPGKDPIPFTKFGRTVRYREDLLLKWIERNTFDDTEQSREAHGTG